MIRFIQREAAIDDSIRLWRVLWIHMAVLTYPDGDKVMSFGFSRNIAQAQEKAQADFDLEFAIWCRRVASAASLIGYGMMLQRQLDTARDRLEDVDAQSQALLAVARMPPVMAALSERGIHIPWPALAT